MPLVPDQPSQDTASAELERELLGGERRWTRQEVSERSGVPYEHANALWRALGFADVGEDVVAFTDRDVWALMTVERLGSEGWLDEQAQIAMTRALGQSLARLAEWQLAATGSMIDTDGTEVQALERATELVPVVEDLIGYVWRRHLAAVAGRALASGSEDLAAAPMTVGFADLVGFTSLTREIDESGLAEIVEGFESRASDIIAESGGRVVKTVGDEVMFVADHPPIGAVIGMRLAEEIGGAGDLPELRVGLACGAVVSRLGDVYGEPANVASRLTSLARPGSVVVDKNMADALGDDPRWRLRRLPPRPVRGYTMLHPYRLRRAAAADEAAGASGS
jgi:adenylate cyclase